MNMRIIAEKLQSCLVNDESTIQERRQQKWLTAHAGCPGVWRHIQESSYRNFPIFGQCSQHISAAAIVIEPILTKSVLMDEGTVPDHEAELVELSW